MIDYIEHGNDQSKQHTSCERHYADNRANRDRQDDDVDDVFIGLRLRIVVHERGVLKILRPMMTSRIIRTRFDSRGQ